MSFLSYLTKKAQEKAKTYTGDPGPSKSTQETLPEGGDVSMCRRHILVRGRVQGVGFRYICTGIANECHVTGWVQNMYDGSVEMEVQGAVHRVDRFLQELKSDAPGGNRWVRIDHLEVKDIPLLYGSEETSFRPRHY